MDAVTIEERGRSARSLNEARRKDTSSGWPFKVKVWAIGSPIEWHMDSPLKDQKTGLLVFDKFRNQMPKEDYYLIKFELHDHSGLNLRFKSNPMDAFSVATDPKKLPDCPAPGCYSSAIYAVACDASSLTVRNDDMDVEYFSFALYFDSDDGDQCYDPGGANQNGNYDYYY